MQVLTAAPSPHRCAVTHAGWTIAIVATLKLKALLTVNKLKAPLTVNKLKAPLTVNKLKAPLAGRLRWRYLSKRLPQSLCPPSV